MTVEVFNNYKYIIALVCLAVAILFALVRAIKGPRTADHIIGINMTGTLGIMTIAVLSLYLKESYLLDVAIIYGLISFLAVVILTRIYIAVHLQAKHKDRIREKKKKESSNG